MNASQLIRILREDYLDDLNKDYQWSDAFLLRSILEAERQACNRSDLIYDDSSDYASIALQHGVASYNLSQKVTRLEYVGLDGASITQKSKAEIDRTDPTWRTNYGMTGKTNYFVMRNRTIRFTPYPHASIDATFIQDSAPTSGMVEGDTWWNTTTSVLYEYISSVWTINATATLKTVSLELFRMPDADTINTGYEFEIQDEYHHDLIYWVLHEAYKKQDSDQFDQEKSLQYLATFNSIFGDKVSAEVRINSMNENPVLTARPIAYIRNNSDYDSIDESW